MLLFLLLLMPLTLILFLYKKPLKTIFPLVFIGFACGVLLCGFKGFFMFSHRIVYYSFWRTFLSLFFTQFFLPIVILYGLFFAISHDELTYKTDAFVPLVFSFYVVFLPFTVISETESVYSGFQVLLKPVLFGSMLILLGFLTSSLFNAFFTGAVKKAVFQSLIALVFLAGPSLIETLYLLTSAHFMVLLVTGIYVFCVLLYLFFTKIVYIKFFAPKKQAEASSSN